MARKEVFGDDDSNIKEWVEQANNFQTVLYSDGTMIGLFRKRRDGQSKESHMLSVV
jgi:hypothetical protein